MCENGVLMWGRDHAFAFVLTSVTTRVYLDDAENSFGVRVGSFGCLSMKAQLQHRYSNPLVSELNAKCWQMLDETLLRTSLSDGDEVMST